GQLRVPQAPARQWHVSADCPAATVRERAASAPSRSRLGLDSNTPDELQRTTLIPALGPEEDAVEREGGGGSLRLAEVPPAVKDVACGEIPGAVPGRRP